MLALAVAVNVAVVAFAATVTEAGAAKSVLLLESDTVEPPAGADWLSVTVHVLDVLCPRLVGLHAKLETRTGATRLILAVCELLPSVAATVAAWLLGMFALAVAVNVAVVAFAATITDAGTVKSVLLLESDIVEPVAGAAVLRITEQFALLLGLMLIGLQVTEETAGTAITPEPAPETANPLASAAAPSALDMLIVVVVALGARVI